MLIETFGGVESICNALETDIKSGLQHHDEKALQERREAFGLNSFPPPKIKTIYELVMENFDDKINVILLIASIVSIVIGLF